MERLARFIVRRVLSAVVTLFVVATLTFFLMNIIPGGPFNTERATKKIVEIMERKYGLDKPLLEQYFLYMGRLLRFDLGDSYKRLGYSVSQILAEKFPVSAGLGGVAICLALVIGVPLGVLAAYRRNSAVDRLIMFVATLGIAVPNFVVATILLLLFGVALGWLPILGISSWQHYIMPAFALSFFPGSFIVRLTRSSMLDVLGQDYIKTARAKGLSERAVVFKHALRISIVPVVTYMGPMAAAVLTGGFVIERIFTIPGMGRYFVESINNSDYPMVMGTTVFFAAMLILCNLIVDLLYGVIDPRIHYD